MPFKTPKPNKFYQTKSPSSTRLSISPPAALTARSAACDNLLLFSIASFSLLAFVFDEPLGATPVKIFLLSFGVKLTKSTDPDILGVRGAISLRLGVRRFRMWKAGDKEDFGEGQSDPLDLERVLCSVGLVICICLDRECAYSWLE